MIVQRRAFYHCFPRLNQRERERLGDLTQRLEDPWYKELSLRTLESILEYGLLLCAEHKYVSGVECEAASPPLSIAEQEIELKQIRACFTLASNARELVSDSRSGTHLDLFGDIGIAITPTTGRALGALPCYYYSSGFIAEEARYKSLEEIVRNKQYGEIRNLTQVRDILMLLAVVEAIARDKESPEIANLIPDLSQVNQVFTSISSVSKEMSGQIYRTVARTELDVASKFVNLFDFPRHSMLSLAWKVEGILDAIQTIDSGARKLELSYFDQREWRIPLVQHTGAVLSCLDTSFDPFKARSNEEIEETAEARNALERVLSFRNRTEFEIKDRRDFWILWGMKMGEEGKEETVDFARLIDRIWCPLSWKRDVQRRIRSVWLKRMYAGPVPDVECWDYTEGGAA